MKIEKIRKRHGYYVKLNPEKIKQCIINASKETEEFDGKVADRLANKVLEKLKQAEPQDRYCTVEDVQDIVEKTLLESKYKDTAKAYIIYREQHAKIRAISTQASVDIVDEYINKSDWRVNENSNMGFSLQGLNNYISSKVSAAYWLNAVYPPKVRKAHNNGDIHTHDLNNLSSYTYFGKEVIIAKINGEDTLLSFEQLYNILDDPEKILSRKDKATSKYPRHVYVLDKNGWTLVRRVIKKKKHRPLRFIKNRGGRSVIVTDNHPMITNKGEVTASDIIVSEDKLYTVDIKKLLKEDQLFNIDEVDLYKEIKSHRAKWPSDKVFFNGIAVDELPLNSKEEGILHTRKYSIPRKIKLTREFGYFVGFTLAEGYLSYDRLTTTTITITQKNKNILLKISKWLRNQSILSFVQYIERNEIYKLVIVNPFIKFLFQEVFRVQTGSRNKTLPINILSYNKEFVKGVLAGLLDGDGTVTSTTIHLPVSTRTLVEQVAIILQIFGFTPRDRRPDGTGKDRKYKGKIIHQNYPIYSVSFRKLKGNNLPSERYQAMEVSKGAWQDETRDEWHIVLNNKKVITHDDYIYDITTESGTLMVNGMWNHNCVGWDLEDLLLTGFGGVKGKIASAPPKHLRSAIGQLYNFIFSLQNESAGAQALSSIDTLLAPFIRYDKLNYKEVKQCVQELVFNLNVATRSGGQTPFSNITLDLTVPNIYKDHPVIIGGKPQKETYSDFQKEMNMFNKAFFEVMLEGDAKGRVFTFPIPTCNITKDFDWNNPNFELMWKLTGKYGVFYFSNFLNSDMKPDDVRSMCLSWGTEIWIQWKTSGKQEKDTIGHVIDKYNKDKYLVLTLMGFKPIKRVIKKDIDKVVTIYLDTGNHLLMSFNHPHLVFLDNLIQIKLAKDLDIGMKCIIKENGELKLTSINKIQREMLSTPVTFYDFEIDDTEVHTFYANDILTHNCCRLRLDNRELRKRGGGLFGANPLTGSINVTTMNMPRLGYLSKTKEEFFQRLEHLMEIGKEISEIKRKVLEKFTDEGLYPYSKFYLRNIKKRFNKYWANHFSTIGLVGMNEACLNFLGKDIGTEEGRAFAEEVLTFMRNKLLKFQEETGNNYNLEASPAEGTAYRLSRIDKMKYPDIICANEEEYKKGAAPFYTNSSQLPVNYTDDIFESFELQDPLQILYTGGCLEGGNKVLTDKGLIPIEDIVLNFENLKPIKVLSYNKEKGISEWDEIVEAVKVDMKQHNKIRIKGERNFDIVTSDWHPFFVLERLKFQGVCPICKQKLSNVKAFATHLRYNISCRDKYSKLPKYHVVEKRADELKEKDYILQNHYNLFPKKASELNEDLLWLIGFFIGNGFITKFRTRTHLERFVVRFDSGHREAIEKIVKILNKYFGCNISVLKYNENKEKCFFAATSKKDVVDFLFKFGFKSGVKVYTVSIRDEIKKNLNTNNVYSLISGLMDSDGHIDKSQGDFEYSTVSDQLADDILELFTLAGILVSKTYKPSRKKNEVGIWKLRVPSYELTKIKEHLINIININHIRNDISRCEKRHFPVVRVKEITKTDIGDNQFYDLMTAKNHNYLAGKNSLVFVHNTVLHGFVGEQLHDVETVKQLVKKLCENFHLPYFTITPTFSVCPQHGYLSGEHFKCPKCASECEVYSRVVGYLRPVQQWNKGKKEEFKKRKVFKTGE